MDLTAFNRVPDKPRAAGEKKARRASALDVLAIARHDVEARTATLHAQLDLAGSSQTGDPCNWVGEVVPDNIDENEVDAFAIDDDEENGSFQAMIDRLIRKNEASVTNGSSKLKSVYHSTRVQASGDSISSIGGSGITQRLSLGTSPKGGAGHMDAAKGNALHADSTTQASSKGAPLHTEPGAAKGGTVNVAAAAAAAASPFNKILMIPTAPLTATQSSASDEAAGSSTGAQLPPRPSVGAGKSRRGSVDMSMVLKANFSCPGGSTGQQQPAAGALRMVGSVCASPSASEPLTLLAPRVPSLTAKSRRNSVDMSGVSAVIQGAMSRLAVADPQSDLAIQPSMSSFTAGTDGGSGARLPIWLTDANASNASAGSMGGNESYLPLNYWKGGGDVAASAGSGNGKEVAAGRRAAGIDRHVLMSVPASGSVSPAPRNGRRAPVLMA